MSRSRRASFRMRAARWRPAPHWHSVSSRRRDTTDIHEIAGEQRGGCGRRRPTGNGSAADVAPTSEAHSGDLRPSAFRRCCACAFRHLGIRLDRRSTDRPRHRFGCRQTRRMGAPASPRQLCHQGRTDSVPLASAQIGRRAGRWHPRNHFGFRVRWRCARAIGLDARADTASAAGRWTLASRRRCVAGHCFSSRPAGAEGGIHPTG